MLALTVGSGCRRVTEEPAATPFAPTVAEVRRHNEGVAYMGQFDYGAAFGVFDELVQRHPEWVAARIDREIARLNRRQGDDDRIAAEQFDAILAEEPDNPRALYCRAILHFNNGQSDAALDKFQQVLELDPRDAYATYYTAQCLLDAGKMEPSLELFQRAQQLDPYLRSAYYGAFQAYRRLGQGKEAEQQLQEFTKLSNNPQGRLAEIAYTRMGPKAEVHPVQTLSEQQPKHPAGPLFERPRALTIIGPAPPWRTTDDPLGAAQVTVCDVDADGQLDLFFTGALDTRHGPPNAVLLHREKGWQWAADHPLAQVLDVTAACWGDFDNDQRVDVFLCRRGPNQLWQQTAEGAWRDVTATAGVAGGDSATANGVWFDADHDGDLDLFVVNRDAPNELWNNNLDGTFRPLAEERGLVGSSPESRAVVVADLDHDRDVDMVILQDQPPHDVFLNDRLWNYRTPDGWDDFKRHVAWAAVAGDTDVDGQVELYTIGPEGLARWVPTDTGQWELTALPQPTPAGNVDRPVQLILQDINGNGHSELLVAHADGCAVLTWDGGSWRASDQLPGNAHAALANLDASAGPSLIVPRGAQGPAWLAPGSGRFGFALLQFTGKADEAAQMRSNAAGIGVQAAARVADGWSAISTFPTHSGPGQHQQPAAVGLAGHDTIDYVALLWPDGLIQSEVQLVGHKLHRIAETQRQVSSCPVVFAWDGAAFRFVTDVLGGGGIGFNLANGQYGDPRPVECLLLPADSLRPTETGHFEIRLGEPMEEAMYVDAAELLAFDVPLDGSLVLDERFAVNGPPPTGRPVFFRDWAVPRRVLNERHEDITEVVRHADHQAAPLPDKDPRFLGRTARHQLLLDFDTPLDQAGATPWLVFDGWVEYPYSQTMFAAWQAGATYDAPTIEALDAAGNWHTVWDQFGYMAGMPRTSSVPLPLDKLPPGTTQLRITTNLEIYWDRLAIAWEEMALSVEPHALPLVAADAARSGFAQRIDHPQRRPEYDYQQRVPLWDTRHQEGWYTGFGPVLPLVATIDDAVAILGPGEELRLRFDTAIPPPPPRTTRRYVLKLHGWCKDMDLYTYQGETIGPLPTRAGVGQRPSEASQRLMNQYNQRFRKD